MKRINGKTFYARAKLEILLELNNDKFGNYFCQINPYRAKLILKKLGLGGINQQTLLEAFASEKYFPTRLTEDFLEDVEHDSDKIRNLVSKRMKELAQVYLSKMESEIENFKNRITSHNEIAQHEAQVEHDKKLEARKKELALKAQAEREAEKIYAEEEAKRYENSMNIPVEHLIKSTIRHSSLEKDVVIDSSKDLNVLEHDPVWCVRFTH